MILHGRFSEGLARVVKADGNEKDISVFIDKNNNIVINMGEDNKTVVNDEFSDGLIMVRKENKIGYMDARGNVLIDFEYDDAFNFSEGLALVKKGDKCVYINKKGEFVIENFDKK